MDANLRDCIKERVYFVELNAYPEAADIAPLVEELEIIVAFDVVLARSLIGAPVCVILGIIGPKHTSGAWRSAKIEVYTAMKRKRTAIIN